MDLAPYINDAHAGQLILLKGVTGHDRPGCHDWESILSQLGWMQYDHPLAGIANGTGVGIILVSFLWGAYMLYLQYKNLDGMFPQSS